MVRPVLCSISSLVSRTTSASRRGTSASRPPKYAEPDTLACTGGGGEQHADQALTRGAAGTA